MSTQTGPRKLNVPTAPPPIFGHDDSSLLIVKPTPDQNDAKASLAHSANRDYEQWLETRQPDQSNRNRISFRFHLNARNRAEFDLSVWLDNLKRERRFLTVVRDALRLYHELSTGNLTVLLELFPWIEDAFDKQLADQKPASSTITDQLARLEQLLLEQGNAPVNDISSGPKPLGVPAVAGPTLYDDMPALVIKTAESDGKSAQNFLMSAFALLG